MAKIWGYHEGDRSELLGRYLLSALGLTIMIERQEDHFGVDLILKLTRKNEKKIEPTGKEASFQIKSNEKQIIINTDSKKKALFDNTSSLFIFVTEKKTRKAKIYSTINRFKLYWDIQHDGHLQRPIHINFGKYYPNPFTEPKSDPKEPRILNCGLPIHECSHDEFENETSRKELIDKIEKWVQYEEDAFFWKASGIPIAPNIPDLYGSTNPPELWFCMYDKDLLNLSSHAKAITDVLRVSAQFSDLPEWREIKDDLLQLKNKLNILEQNTPQPPNSALLKARYYDYKTPDLDA